MVSSITQSPICPHCESVLKSWTNDPCQCDGAKADREQREKQREIQRQSDITDAAERKAQSAECEAEKKAESDKMEALHRKGWAELRRQGAKDQADAAKETSLHDRKLVLEDKELAERERQQAKRDRVAAERERPPGEPAEGLTLADFTREVTLLGVERLPSAFDRSDGATLLYQGRFNTIYGEAAMGKTWIAIMTAIQQLRAGRRVVWWDSEDRPSTLATRLQVLRATDLIGTPELAWIAGDIQDNPAALAEALEFLDGGAIPGLVVIDSATSFGCPSDGADVAAWLKAFIEPWWNAGHTVLLLDHVPKQKKDRPRGGIGSQAKLARVDGAALYAHGVPWNGQEGGYVHLTTHKDRQGELPATLNNTVATISASWDGPTLAYTIGLPNAKAEGENLEDELLEAMESAGTEGVKGSRAIRDMMKGKRAKDIDAACKELLAAGLIERVREGKTYTYTAAS